MMAGATVAGSRGDSLRRIGTCLGLLLLLLLEKEKAEKGRTVFARLARPGREGALLREAREHGEGERRSVLLYLVVYSISFIALIFIQNKVSLYLVQARARHGISVRKETVQHKRTNI